MMAPPDCMSGDGQAAVFVGTFLQTGDAVALCDNCLVPWSAAILQSMTGVDPAPFIKAVSDVTEDVPPPAQPGPTIPEPDIADPPRSNGTPRRSGRTRLESVAPGTETAPSEEREPPGENDTAAA